MICLSKIEIYKDQLQSLKFYITQHLLFNGSLNQTPMAPEAFKYDFSRR